MWNMGNDRYARHCLVDELIRLIDLSMHSLRLFHTPLPVRLESVPRQSRLAPTITIYEIQIRITDPPSAIHPHSRSL